MKIDVQYEQSKTKSVKAQRYLNLPSKLLPNNFFTNMFAHVCNNMY